jgi:excisionase family DNA binding protein
MEKICIVKRRRIGFQPDTARRLESGLRIQAVPRPESGPRVETISRIEAVSRTEDLTSPVTERQNDSGILTIDLTPEQMDRIRANGRFQQLYGASQAPIFLNLHLETGFSIRMLKSSQICDMLQISRSTLARLVRTGCLRSHRIGRLRRFSVEDVIEFLGKEVTVAGLRSVRSKGILAGSQAT